MQDLYVKERERTRIPDEYKWDLTAIYQDDETWERAQKAFAAEFPKISAFAGKLSESPDQLFGCFDRMDRLGKEYVRLSCFSSMKSDLDTRDAKYLAMDQEMSQIGSDLSAACSFVEPEILRIGADRIHHFISQDPRLAPYRHIFDNILRKKAHTRTEGEEKILAEASLMADAPATINSIFTNADFPYPTVQLEDGTSVRLDPSAFSLQRRSHIRENRKKVFASYLGKMNEFRRTLGAQLASEVRKNMFFTRTRFYPSCMERALNAFNIPAAVYRNLIAGAHEHIETLHRYLHLRKRMLGLDELHYYDLYAPIVKELDLNYTYEEACKHVLDSLVLLGPEYLETARQALSNRWVDVYANDGKRSGAYSNGAVYDAHPYMLLNYNGKYDDVSTLTHELGHTMHSYLTNKAQPYALSHYSIFVAEVASTFNEALLLNHMLEVEKREEVRLSLLGNYLDNARATVFRQVQFAEFELKIHELAEGGTALTGDLLNSVYGDIAKEYYGHKQGVCIVDDEIQSEWAYIPHFYYNFYVYQYATSYTASTALAAKVIAGDTSAAAGYLELLSSGGSDYPIALLQKAGVDMTTRQPLDATILQLNRVMDEIETIASRLGFLKS
jgi:oligoendopeptidase F